jgi:AcrR family transcriptional regulator
VATDVKRRRSHGGKGGQARTRLARAAVVGAARALFLQRGYAATTIETISDQSDVPAATVYRLFSSKLGILKALLDASIAGDDEAVALQDRPHVRALLADPDARNQLSGLADIVCGIMSRAEPSSGGDRQRTHRRLTFPMGYREGLGGNTTGKPERQIADTSAYRAGDTEPPARRGPCSAAPRSRSPSRIGRCCAPKCAESLCMPCPAATVLADRLLRRATARGAGVTAPSLACVEAHEQLGHAKFVTVPAARRPVG